MEQKIQKGEAPVELKYSFIGGTFYAIFRLAQIIQATFPTLLLWAATKSTLWIFRTRKSEAELEKPKAEPFKYRIDYSKRTHRIVWPVLTKLQGFAQWFAGMHTDRSLYERLLTWGSQLPVLGYRDSDKSTAIEYFGKREPGGSADYNVFWLSTPLPAGRFQVVTKKLDAEGKITIRCVWVTGRFAGKSFDIESDFSRYKSWKDDSIPAHIYFPNRFFVYLAELATSAALILSIVGLSEKGVTVLSSVAKEGRKLISELATFVANLLHKIFT